MTDLLGPGAFGAARPAAIRPTLTPANGAGDPDSWAKDCSSPTTNDGTENRAGLFNALLAQLRLAIRKNGVVADNTDDAMLARAIQLAGVSYHAAGGTANALTITLDPAPTALTDGMPLRFLPTGPNTTAAVTLNVNGLGAVPLLNSAGQNVGPGALAAVGMEAVYVGGNWYLVSTPAHLNRAGGAVVYNAPGTYTHIVQAGVYRLRRVLGVGGGGSGGGSSGLGVGASGAGAGGWFDAVDVPVTPGQAITVIVGAGSTTVAGNTDGTAGGSTSVSGIASATGGGGKVNGGTGGASGLGTLSGGIAGDAGFGGGGFTIGAAGSIGGQGGGTLYGTGGIPALTGTSGTGSTPGSGGAGGYDNNAGGHGANGRVVIEY